MLGCQIDFQNWECKNVKKSQKCYNFVEKTAKTENIYICFCFGIS